MGASRSTGLLKSTQVKIDTALSGAAAVEFAEKNSYDLILLDQRMLIQYLPEDIVHRTAAASADGAEAAVTSRFTPLRDVGVDPETGLSYCQNEEELYCSVLKDYAESADEKI